MLGSGSTGNPQLPMQVKKELDHQGVVRIQGQTSRELADKCPDRLVVFPSSPCTNIGCEYSIKQPGYMNCTFVAAEAGGEHTLESVGEMMGISREGVRKIEVRALRKFREALDQESNHEARPPILQSRVPPGTNRIDTVGPIFEYKDSGNQLSARDDRELGECAG